MLILTDFHSLPNASFCDATGFQVTSALPTTTLVRIQPTRAKLMQTLRVLFIVAVLFVRSNLPAEPLPVVDWAFTDGTPFPDNGHGICVDAVRNFYVCGSFGMAASNVALAADATYLKYTSQGVVIKFSPERQRMWQFKLGGKCSSSIQQVCSPDESGVYALGSYFEGAVEVGTNQFSLPGSPADRRRHPGA